MFKNVLIPAQRTPKNALLHDVRQEKQKRYSELILSSKHRKKGKKDGGRWGTRTLDLCRVKAAL